MSVSNVICDCSFVIDKVEVWFLKDIGDFESRKLVKGVCPKCHRPVIKISPVMMPLKFSIENVKELSANILKYLQLILQVGFTDIMCKLKIKKAKLLKSGNMLPILTVRKTL